MKKSAQDTQAVNVEGGVLLAFSVIAVRTVVSPEDICLILLDFGSLLKLPLHDSTSAVGTQAERMMMIEMDREGPFNLMAEIRYDHSEKAFVSSRSPLSLKYGDKVLVFRETMRC